MPHSAAAEKQPLDLLASLRLSPRGAIHLPPLRVNARRVPLRAGEILLLPGGRRGRPIAGMTVLELRDRRAPK